MPRCAKRQQSLARWLDAENIRIGDQPSFVLSAAGWVIDKLLKEGCPQSGQGMFGDDVKLPSGKVVRRISYTGRDWPPGYSPDTHVLINMNAGFIDVSRFNPQLKSVGQQEPTEIVEAVRHFTIPLPAGYTALPIRPTPDRVSNGRLVRPRANRISFNERIDAALGTRRGQRLDLRRRQGRT